MSQRGKETDRVTRTNSLFCSLFLFSFLRNNDNDGSKFGQRKKKNEEMIPAFARTHQQPPKNSFQGLSTHCKLNTPHQIAQTTTMQAVVLTESGGVDVLKLVQDHPLPTRGPGQVGREADEHLFCEYRQCKKHVLLPAGAGAHSQLLSQPRGHSCEGWRPYVPPKIPQGRG